MNYRQEGLGSVSAADGTLAGIDRTRLMSPASLAQRVAALFVCAGGVTEITLRPFYVNIPAPGMGLSLTDTDRWEDPSQEVSYAADGTYAAEFRHVPGTLIGFRVVSLTGGTVTLYGRHLPGPAH